MLLGRETKWKVEKNLIAKLKGINNNPIAVGFGISTPEHVKKLVNGADGVLLEVHL